MKISTKFKLLAVFTAFFAVFAILQCHGATTQKIVNYDVNPLAPASAVLYDGPTAQGQPGLAYATNVITRGNTIIFAQYATNQDDTILNVTWGSNSQSFFIPAPSVPAAASGMPSFSTGLQQVYDSMSGTNFAFVSGYMRSTTGQKNIAFGSIVYNVSPSVGMVLGYDDVWVKGASQQSWVKGGVQLQATLYPFKGLGWTNTAVKPFGFGLVSSGGGNVSEILGAGMEMTFYTWKSLDFGGGVLYENRTGGSSAYTGDYVGGFVDIKYRIPHW